MGFLDKAQLDRDVEQLVNRLEKSQWEYRVDFKEIEGLPIMSRDDLRKITMTKGFYRTTSSGSTGEPISIEKTYEDYIWYLAVSIRELKWRGWDLSKDLAIIHAKKKNEDKPSWGMPAQFAPVQGRTYFHQFAPISELQAWLELKNPHYIHVFPSILKQLDLSKIPNFIDWKGTGEVGAPLYSSEECGIIAMQCPQNPEVMHVMENILLEEDVDGGAIITSLTNPYIKRYKHGDQIELGSCFCGRTLQTIKSVKGRARGLFVMPNGDRKWPVVGSGSVDYYKKFGIRQFKVIQLSLDQIRMEIIAPPLEEKEAELIEFVQKCLETTSTVTIKYVDHFEGYKHEEFVSLVSYP